MKTSILRPLIFSSLVILGSVFVHDSISLLIRGNLAARCILHARTNANDPYSACQQDLRSVAGEPNACLFLGRLASYAERSDVVEDALEHVDIAQLGQLEAQLLLKAHYEQGNMTDAVKLIEFANIPTETMVEWALQADQNRDIETARLWLHAAELHKDENLAWGTRRWLGWLWWSVEKNDDKALFYLEPVAAQAPGAMHPKLLLASVYQDNSIDKAIAVLESAYQLDPTNLEALYRLWHAYDERGYDGDLAKRDLLGHHASSLILKHLRIEPDDARFQAWLEKIRSSS